MRLESVKIEIDPYPNRSRSMIRVTVTGESKSVGGGVWHAGRSVSVETEGPIPPDERAQLEQTLARALDALEKLDA